ncbi:MAG TPA: glycoside hydrolase family 30 beta sandwich domain-containing protein [Sphingobacteriaceae bacterium]
MIKTYQLPFRLMILIFTGLMSCKLPAVTEKTSGRPVSSGSEVSFWLTKPDSSSLLQEQIPGLVFSGKTGSGPAIEVDPTRTYQSMEGFGFTLTGGSAALINAMDESKKDSLLRELFSDDKDGIGISYLRISVGASDLSAEPFTYNDLPEGDTDIALQHFTLDREKTDLLPILKKIVAIRPGIKIMGSPWTAPRWMKTNKSFIGGSLKPEFYGVYADYFVKYIQAMKAEGITIDAITVQNEPLHPGNNPSMYMEAKEQGEFIKHHLGPAIQKAGITTRIILYDHNLDKPEYPISILNDPETRKFVDGSAFHLYAGDIRTMSQVHLAHPDKHVYFTEQWIGGPGKFADDFKWHMDNLIIGAPRNWSRNVLEWNLAADARYEPHTDKGGCTSCLGALTISNQNVKRNTAYYVIAHASKFVKPGSVRIHTNTPDYLPNVGFRTPDGKTVLIVLNNGAIRQDFAIKFHGKTVSAGLDPGAAGTFMW